MHAEDAKKGDAAKRCDGSGWSAGHVTHLLLVEKRDSGRRLLDFRDRFEVLLVALHRECGAAVRDRHVWPRQPSSPHANLLQFLHTLISCPCAISALRKRHARNARRKDSGHISTPSLMSGKKLHPAQPSPATLRISYCCRQPRCCCCCFPAPYCFTLAPTLAGHGFVHDAAR